MHTPAVEAYLLRQENFDSFDDKKDAAAIAGIVANAERILAELPTITNPRVIPVEEILAPMGSGLDLSSSAEGKSSRFLQYSVTDYSLEDQPEFAKFRHRLNVVRGSGTWMEKAWLLEELTIPEMIKMVSLIPQLICLHRELEVLSTQAIADLARSVAEAAGERDESDRESSAVAPASTNPHPAPAFVFRATNHDESDPLHLADLLERYSREAPVNPQMTEDQAASTVLNRFKRTVLSQLELLELNANRIR